MTSDETPSDRRLDSWKAIAGYLSRDVSTVRRWERTMGLPVRRVQGTKGNSVFAFTAELDGWLKSHDVPTEGADVTAPAGAMQPVYQSVEGASKSSRAWLPRAAGLATLAIILFVLFVVWRVWAPSVSAQDLKLSVDSTGVTATTAAGRALWHYNFPPGEKTDLPAVRERAIAVSSPDAVLVATAISVRLMDDMMHGGQLLELSLDGRQARTFSFEDQVVFSMSTFSPPWAVTDFRVDAHPGRWQVALAAHHFRWWPSLVTVLDSNWQRRGTFVHPGWIEMIQWLSPERLVVAGYSNEREGGMAALLDPAALDGQAPVDPASPFYCASCGKAAPLRYVIFPRTEVNRASGSPINRARLQLNGNLMTVRTLETADTSSAGPAEVLYEFSSTLDLVSASHGDRYWELHKELEAAGKLDHPRSRCPDRDGPHQIQVWEPASGWRTVQIGK